MVSIAQRTLRGIFSRQRDVLRPALAAWLLTALCSALPAASLTWDIAPGAVGPGDGTLTGGSGTWDTSNGNWTADGGANNVAWPASGTDNDAVFQGTAGTVSIAAGGVTANDVTFNSGTYTIQNNTLTLNGVAPTITLNNVSANINSTLALASDATVHIAGATAQRLLVLNGGLSGANRSLSVTVDGSNPFYSGLMINAAGSFSGSLSVSNASATGQAQLGISQPAAQNALIDTDVTLDKVYFQLGNGANGNLVQVRSLAGGSVSNNVSSDNRANTLVIGTNNNTLGSTTYFGNLTNGGGPGANLSLIKNGTATQVLAGTNTYTGTTTINGGVLSIGSAANLPASSALTLAGGTLAMTGSMTLANNVTVAAGQAGTLRMVGATTGTLTGDYSGVAGTLTLDVSGGSGYSGMMISSANGPAAGAVVNIIGTSNASNVQVGLTNSAYQSFFSNAKVVFSGTGNLYLAAGNGSATNLTFGALEGGVSSTNIATNQGTMIGFDNRTGAVTIAGVTDGDFSGTIFNGYGGAGALSVTKNGSSTQTFSGTNFYTGTTTINDGTLSIGSAASLPASSALTLAGGGALAMTGSMTLANNVTVAAGQAGTLRMVGATTGALTGNYSGVAGTLTLDVSGGSGYSGMMINSANGPAAGAVVNIIGTSNANNVQVGLTNSAYQSFFSNAKVVFSGTGNLFVAAGNGSANNLTFGALEGGVSSTNTGANLGTLIGFDNRTGAVTIAGVTDGNFSGTIFNGNGSAGPLSVTKNGSSTQTFSGANFHTGTTTINDGTLRVNGTHTGAGLYTVNSGGTLGGLGSIAGGVLVNSGGHLAPGASAGTLTVNSVTMTSGSFFDVEIAGPSLGSYDRLTVNGAAALGGATLTVSLLGGYEPSLGSVFYILSSSNLSGFFDGLANDDTFLADQQLWRIRYGVDASTNDFTAGSGQDVGLMAVEIAGVPEPSTLLLAALGAVGLAVVRARRRRSQAH